ADAGQVAADLQDVILAIEDDAAIGFGIAALKSLRSAGLSADMIATGSPRKRFDKASKLLSRVLVGVALRDGKIACNVRSAEHVEVLARVNAVLEALTA
ncbi:MAG: histidine--tRNA ligase, partial [Novosphingobium sp.]